LFEPVAFAERKQLSPELAFRFVHAGHILGSSMVELFLRLDGDGRNDVPPRGGDQSGSGGSGRAAQTQSGGANRNPRKFLFTGDIGRVPLQPTTPGRVVRTGPDQNEDPELLVMESTYGNREHPHDDVRPELAKIVSDTVKRGGSVVVPA